MAQTKSRIQALLAAAGAAPRHRFGQNFMIDGNLVRLVADTGELSAADLAIEVGPGTGTLTEELLSRAARVVAVEIDRDLAGLLRQTFAAEPRLDVIESDALAGKHAINAILLDRIAIARADGLHVKLVANLPYNIASPLVIELLIAGADLLAFTVQREVAQRMAADPAADAYGPLSVMVQLLGQVEILRTLPASAFWPAPKIESALVRIRRHDRLGPHAVAVGRIVHALFAARRKTLRKALSIAGLDPAAILSATGLDPAARPEVLTPNDFLAIHRAVADLPTTPAPRVHST